MPSKTKSPYTTQFTSAVKNGTPCSTAVFNISKKTKTPPSTIWNSLCKSGVCCRTKFNGTWVYWPNFPVKKNTTTCNTTQTNMWQSFVEWCVSKGWCTPNQLNKNCTSQKSFMTFCRNFFGKQYTWNNTKKRTGRKPRKTTPNWKTTTWTSKHTKKTSKPRPTPHWTTSYKFPSFKTRPSTRRYARAA